MGSSETFISWSQAVPGEVQIGYQKAFLHGEGGQSLEWAAHGGGGVPTPGGIQETCRCSSEGYGLVMGSTGQVGGWT